MPRINSARGQEKKAIKELLEIYFLRINNMQESTMVEHNQHNYAETTAKDYIIFIG